MSTDDRFGVVAVKSGFISPEQLIEALKTQVLDELNGNGRRLIGKVLYEKGHITMPQIAEVLVSMSTLGAS